MLFRRAIALLALLAAAVGLVAISMPSSDATFSDSRQGTLDISIQIPVTPTPPPFDWNWPYPGPTCEGVTIVFPVNLPQSQQGVMEVGVLGGSISGMLYKLEGDAYKAAYPNGHAGETVFLPWSSFRNYKIPSKGTWTVTQLRVHGTNYNWKGSLTCGSTVARSSLFDEQSSQESTPTDESGMSGAVLDDQSASGE